MEIDVEAYLRRRYEGQIADIEIVEKEDLDLVREIRPLYFLRCYFYVHFACAKIPATSQSFSYLVNVCLLYYHCRIMFNART